jgi:hypothetical protein
MLFLIHNIHTGLNLNNLNILEQYYSLYTNNIVDLNNIESITEKGNLDFSNIKNITFLYINKSIPFSF